MLILFLLITMRISGAILFHPLFGRTDYPPRMKAMLIFALSLLLYSWTGGRLSHEPETLLELSLMLLRELYVGFCLSFGMELAFTIIRYATSVMDFAMGLSMAQVFDPSSNSQSTVSTGLFYGFFLLLLLATDGHLRYLELLFRTAELLPFGALEPELRELPGLMLSLFSDCIRMGLEIAFPIVGIELMTEAAVGILMRIIPQINIFSVNFQLKIIVGLLMLFFLLVPMVDRMQGIVEYSLETVGRIIGALQ